MNPKSIKIKEWDSVFIKGYELTSLASRETAKALKEKGIIEIIELKEGLQVNSNSYVGKITFDNLQISVSPKLNGIPLYKLLRYAYDLRDIKLFDLATHSLNEVSFFDLLIYELYNEVEDLVRRGALKDYIRNEEKLSSPRGRIDTVRLSRQGGIISDKLPCIYFNRSEDIVLNQIVFAGLKLGLELVTDNSLRLKLERLYSIFSETVSPISLDRVALKKAKTKINRLTERYTGILELINILYESRGIQLEDSSISINLHGYFFDMNAFFETLIGRLLSECKEHFFIKDQFNLYDMFIYVPSSNPRGRRSSVPRPDYALMKEGKVVRLLDAKYRDLWEKSLPRDMLYQLAVYSLSGVGDRTATILYPALTDTPVIQKIKINNPVSGELMGFVNLQPVNLEKVANLLYSNITELKSYISSIVS